MGVVLTLLVNAFYFAACKIRTTGIRTSGRGVDKCNQSRGTQGRLGGQGGSGGTSISPMGRLAPRRRHHCSCFFLRTTHLGIRGSCSTTFSILRRYLAVGPGTSSTLCRVTRCCVCLGRIPLKRTTLRGTIRGTPSGC